jgi:anti-anti-sigma factor
MAEIDLLLREEAFMVPGGASQPTMRLEPGAEPLSDVDSTGLFSVIVRQPSPAVSVIHIAGEVDLLTGPLLHDHLSALLATRPECLIIDLSQVSFLGATGLTALINTRRAATQQGTTLRRFLAVSSGFSDQVCVVPAWRVDEGVMVSLAA